MSNILINIESEIEHDFEVVQKAVAQFIGHLIHNGHPVNRVQVVSANPENVKRIVAVPSDTAAVSPTATATAVASNTVPIVSNATVS